MSETDFVKNTFLMSKQRGMM